MYSGQENKTRNEYSRYERTCVDDGRVRNEWVKSSVNVIFIIDNIKENRLR